MEKDVKIPALEKTFGAFMVGGVDLEKMTDTEFAKKVNDKLAEYSNFENEELMKFLKERGHRPKPTTKYAKALKYRLKKKGLRLWIKRTTIPTYSEMNLHISFSTSFAIVPIVEPQGESIKIPKLKLIEPKNTDLEDAQAYKSPNEWHHDSLVYSGILDRKTELVTIPRTMLDEMIALLQEHGKGTKQKVLAMLKEVGK